MPAMPATDASAATRTAIVPVLRDLTLTRLRGVAYVHRDGPRSAARRRHRARRREPARLRRRGELAGAAGRALGHRADHVVRRHRASRCASPARCATSIPPLHREEGHQEDRPLRPVRASPRRRWRSTTRGLTITPENARAHRRRRRRRHGRHRDASRSTHRVFLEGGLKRVSPFFIPRLIPNMAPGQIAIRFGCTGVNYTPTSACASGGHAVGEAFRLIRYGEQDVMITGGAEAAVTPLGVGGFAVDARPVDAQRRADARQPAVRHAAATASSSARAPASWCSNRSTTRTARGARIYCRAGRLRRQRRRLPHHLAGAGRPRRGRVHAARARQTAASIRSRSTTSTRTAPRRRTTTSTRRRRSSASSASTPRASR